MASMIARLQWKFRRLSGLWRLTYLVLFIALVASWKQRVALKTLIQKFLLPRPKPIIVFAIGTPSTDKDTLIANVAHDFSFEQINIGQWLASLRYRPDEVGALVRKSLVKQIPMPAAHLVPLLRAHIRELQDKGTNRFIIDGFPRNRESAELWDRKAGTHNLSIYFDIPVRRAKAQYAGIVRKRIEGSDSLTLDDVRRLVERRFREHELDLVDLEKYLNGRKRFVKIEPPDKTNKSYAIVLDALRKHPRGAEVFK